MKLRDLLSEIKRVQVEIGASEPFVCGGTPRDKVMGNLKNISDLDITTGDKTVDYLSQKFYNSLNKKFNIYRKIMSDGHSTIFFGNLKIDFSSNFNVPNIDAFLKQNAIDNPTDIQREIFSRDFTCNSLLMPFDFSKVIDLTNKGLQDIKDKKIRTCLSPEVAFLSNKNRVSRAIYLACKLGFDLDQSIIDFVTNKPESVRFATTKSLSDKIDEAFKQDGDKASYLITKMGLWNFVPINEVAYPYYIKNVKGKPNVAQ